MTLGLFLKIGGALLALVWGVWLGLPGRYTQSVDDIEKAMAAGVGRRRTAKRIFTPLSWLTRSPDAGTRGGRRRGAFRLAPRDDR